MPCKKKRLIHSVSVAQFDELEGNTLSYIYPKSPVPKIESHKTQDVAELCLPDGGHKHSSDAVYIRLSGENEVPLYGFAFFRNRPDEKEKRGAKQIAILIIAMKPHFDRFRPFLSVAVERYLDLDEDRQVIHELYHALESSYQRTRQLAKTRFSSFYSTAKSNSDSSSDEEEYTDDEAEDGKAGVAKASETRGGDADSDASSLSRGQDSAELLARGLGSRKKSFGSLGKLRESNTCTVELWDKLFVMQPLFPLQRNEFGGASLRDFVLRFKIQTMTIWYGVMSLKRILFCSQDSKAHVVGSLVLATPLLVGPSIGMLVIPQLVPYLTLANVDPMTKQNASICGATNGLFATKKAWYNILADPGTGKVVWEPSCVEERAFARVTGTDLAFINRVLDGIENKKRDEAWVREQFATFTKTFLESVKALEEERAAKRGSDTSVGLGFNLKASFLSKRASKTPSSTIAMTFAGSQLWLRYRWLQLNPESFQNGHRRHSKVRSIETADSVSARDDDLVPPVPPSRPEGSRPFADKRPQSNRVSFSGTASSIFDAQLQKDQQPVPSQGSWCRAVTPQGEDYWWNRETKETRWDRPGPEEQGKADPLGANQTTNAGKRINSAQSFSSSSNGTLSSGPADPPPYDVYPRWVQWQGRYQKVNCVMQHDSFTNTCIKSKWVEAFDESKERYFWHLDSEESVWELPDLAHPSA